MKKADFRIIKKPVQIEFTCTNCGEKSVLPWNEVDEPESWYGDSWGAVFCRACETWIELGDWECE